MRYVPDTPDTLTGSSIWQYLYSFPPVPAAWIDNGFKDFGKRWTPILDEFKKVGVKFALEVHPTEIAFDIASAERAIGAVNGHECFGFNYDPIHFATRAWTTWSSSTASRTASSTPT